MRPLLEGFQRVALAASPCMAEAASAAPRLDEPILPVPAAPTEDDIPDVLKMEAGAVTVEREPLVAHLPAVAAAGPAELILVAEDDPINQRVVLAQLQRLGFQAEVAADGGEALARMREGNFALLITDLQMPNMDGFELSRAVRKEPGHLGRIPIIALTANALGGESERCLAAGMNDYLTKPLLLPRLKATIERWMNGTATTAPALSGATASAPTTDLGARDEPVDTSVLPLLVGSDPGTLAEFYQDFSESAIEAAVVLGEAARAGRGAEIVSAAHRLRGSARSIGAVRLGDLCAQTEAAARSADLALTSSSLALLLDELAAVRTWIASRHAADIRVPAREG